MIEWFFDQMNQQLHEKFSQQDRQLIAETNLNSPLFIQRRQLKKDIDDFQILNQRKDLRAIQQICDRVEHMAMFHQRTTPIIKPMTTRICSYQVGENDGREESFDHWVFRFCVRN